jgi:hypothetical protein
MESVHHVPIEAFPCAASLVQRELGKREDRVVDLFRIDSRGRTLPPRSQTDMI